MSASNRMPAIAGVELGGTKCVCILGTGPTDIRDRVRIPTTTPAETLAQIEQVLARWSAGSEPPTALGVASFGPLNLDPHSPRYGHIIATTKPGWSHTDVAQRLAARVNGPLGFDTDVNGAALAEGAWGAARGLLDFAYVTVGTGIGVGVIIAGRPVVGFTHSELGHIRVVRARADEWPGVCSFHGDCLEGLASGPAIEARAAASGATLGSDHEVWKFVAHALGQLAHTLVLATAPRRIVMGGGVMTAQSHLFARVRSEFSASLGNYVEAAELSELENFIVPPALGDDAGPLGALRLGQKALDSNRI